MFIFDLYEIILLYVIFLRQFYYINFLSVFTDWNSDSKFLLHLTLSLMVSDSNVYVYVHIS